MKWRLILLCTFMVGLGLGVVFLRSEQRRCARRVYGLESKWMQLRRDLWTVELQVARLRTPQEIRDKLDRFHIELGNNAQPIPSLSSR